MLPTSDGPPARRRRQPAPAEAARGLQGSAAPGAWPRRADPPDGLTTSGDNSVQQPERLLPIARNHYSPHQQLKRPSATVLALATDQMIGRQMDYHPDDHPALLEMPRLKALVADPLQVQPSQRSGTRPRFQVAWRRPGSHT